MTTHNRVWLILIVLGWLALLGSAVVTDGFTHKPWSPRLAELMH